jgi:hypothetical protein
VPAKSAGYFLTSAEEIPSQRSYSNLIQLIIVEEED